MDADQTNSQSQPTTQSTVKPHRLLSLRRRAMALWAVAAIFVIYVVWWVFAPTPTASANQRMDQATAERSGDNAAAAGGGSV